MKTSDPNLQAMYNKMMQLALDTSSELYHEGRQRSGAGHRCAFWDGYNGLKLTPHVIPGTFSAACAAAGPPPSLRPRESQQHKKRPVQNTGPALPVMDRGVPQFYKSNLCNP